MGINILYNDLLSVRKENKLNNKKGEIGYQYNSLTCGIPGDGRRDAT